MDANCSKDTKGRRVEWGGDVNDGGEWVLVRDFDACVLSHDPYARNRYTIFIRN